MQGSQTLSRRSAIPSKNRNRFSKLNKSSSLHDIAHGLAGNGFVSLFNCQLALGLPTVEMLQKSCVKNWQSKCVKDTLTL